MKPTPAQDTQRALATFANPSKAFRALNPVFAGEETAAPVNPGGSGGHAKPRKALTMNSYENDHTSNPRQDAKLERDPVARTLAAREAQEGNPARVLVRVTSVRKRLIDEDNLCEKFHVDACRYAGLLHSDEPGKTKIEVSQRKAEKGEAEHTQVTLTFP